MPEPVHDDADEDLGLVALWPSLPALREADRRRAARVARYRLPQWRRIIDAHRAHRRTPMPRPLLLSTGPTSSREVTIADGSLPANPAPGDVFEVTDLRTGEALQVLATEAGDFELITAGLPDAPPAPSAEVTP
jgi:hypothetical protein